MRGTPGFSVTPRNEPLVAEVLRERLLSPSTLNRILCRIGFHERRDFENLTFCASCFVLLCGDEKDLRSALCTAEFQVEKSTILAAQAHTGTFAYEDNCESIRLEDVLTLELLRLVLEKLKIKNKT